MSQYPTTNISMSNVINFMYNSNINSPINLSTLFNYSVDNPKTGIISLGSIGTKYRTFLPTDIPSLIGWFDCRNNTNTSNFINLTSNIFNFSNITAPPPIYNGYKLNGYPTLNFNNNNNGYYCLNYLDINNQNVLFSKNLTISIVHYNNNYNNILSGGDFSNIPSFLNANNTTNNNVINTFTTIPCIYSIILTSGIDNNLVIDMRLNGSNLITTNNTFPIGKSALNLNSDIYLFKNTTGYLSELLIYNEKLASSNLDLVEEYLATKWLGLPSYLLSSSNIYKEINPPNLINFPSCLIRFDKPTVVNLNNIILNNYGNKGSLLSATFNNNYLNYLSNPNYNVITNGLIISFNFNNTTITYNSYNIRANSSASTTIIDGITSINLNNNYYEIYTTATNNYTSYSITFWFYINGSFTDNLISILTDNNTNIDIISISNNKLKIFNDVLSLSATITNNKWYNICLVFSNQNKCSLYLNCIFIADITNITTQIFNRTLKIRLNKSLKNINYYDFKVYNRNLYDYEIQQIFGLSIIMKTYNNTTGYIFNNKYSSLLIDYNNIKSLIFDYDSFSISFNITLFNANFTYINIIYVSKYLKISLIKYSNNFYIELYNKLVKNYYPFTFNLSTSYNINIINNNCYINKEAKTNTTLNSYTDPYNTDYISDSYFGFISSNLNINNDISPFMLENLQIYNYAIDTLFNVNYSQTPQLSYVNQLYPLTYINLNPITYYNIGPNYNDYVNYLLTYNNSWVSNANYLNINNGIIKLTIPKNGYYNFIAAGAAGGNSYTVHNNNYGGRGIIVSNDSYLYKNDLILIGIGQQGGNAYNKINAQGGGGGMTFIYNSTSNDIILVAGGGGGNGDYSGTDAVITTSGNSDYFNITNKAIKGNGGYSGFIGSSGGNGAGGGGFNTDGELINNYNGISFSNIYYNNNNLNTNLSGGGLGGFPSGATGGVGLSRMINQKYIWGGGGGGGYSGGCGGAAYSDNTTLGGGGGGSFDKTSYNNNAKIIISEQNNGYSLSNGYVKINFLANDSYLKYSLANSNIITKNLVLLIEPFNNYSYDIKIPLGIKNLVNGNYCDIDNSDCYLYNNYLALNNNAIILNNNVNIISLSIMFEIRVNTKNTNIIDTTLLINNNCYLNDNISITTIDSIINLPENSWNFITIFGNFNNTISLFNYIDNVNTGPIIGYSRIININEHINNYNIYKI